MFPPGIGDLSTIDHPLAGFITKTRLGFAKSAIVLHNHAFGLENAKQLSSRRACSGLNFLVPLVGNPGLPVMRLALLEIPLGMLALFIDHSILQLNLMDLVVCCVMRPSATIPCRKALLQNEATLQALQCLMLLLQVLAMTNKLPSAWLDIQLAFVPLGSGKTSSGVIQQLVTERTPVLIDANVPTGIGNAKSWIMLGTMLVLLSCQAVITWSTDKCWLISGLKCQLQFKGSDMMIMVPIEQIHIIVNESPDHPWQANIRDNAIINARRKTSGVGICVRWTLMVQLMCSGNDELEFVTQFTQQGSSWWFILTGMMSNTKGNNAAKVAVAISQDDQRTLPLSILEDGTKMVPPGFNFIKWTSTLWSINGQTVNINPSCANPNGKTSRVRMPNTEITLVVKIRG